MTKLDKPTFAPPYHTFIPIASKCACGVGQYIKTCQSVVQVACPDCESIAGEACKDAGGKYKEEKCQGRLDASFEGKLPARRSLARLAHKIANWLEHPESYPYHYHPQNMKSMIARLLVPLQRYVETETIWPEEQEVIETESWSTYCGAQARANCPKCGKYEAWVLFSKVPFSGKIPLEMDNPPPCSWCGLGGKKLVLISRVEGNLFPTYG